QIQSGFRAERQSDSLVVGKQEDLQRFLPLLFRYLRSSTASIEIDEEGSQAAAATVAEFMVTSSRGGTISI
ncbi:hypothetical protein PENTCL1PPCAC_21801, partial [Pristionchus entomophagus]